MESIAGRDVSHFFKGQKVPNRQRSEGFCLMGLRSHPSFRLPQKDSFHVIIIF